MKLAQIAISGIPYAADRLYTYFIPEDMHIEPGIRVTVPFGRGNRSTEGFVLELTEGEGSYKPLREALDDEPLLQDEMLRLIRWMKARYFCTYYDAIKCILPSGVWFRYRDLWRLADGLDINAFASKFAPDSVEFMILRELSSVRQAFTENLAALAGSGTGQALRKLLGLSLVSRERVPVRTVSDKSLRMVSLAVSGEDAMAEVQKKRYSAPVQFAVVEILRAEGTLPASDVYYYTGAKAATLRSLEKSGILRFSSEEVLRVPVYEYDRSALPPVLNAEQEAAFQALDRIASSGEGRVALLHGVTASGKTQVYIRLIQETLQRGRTALLLVPEIALTPQMMAKFTSYFGQSVALLHSALKLTERYDQWKRIRRGEVKVVLGTRSSVFAPLENLGLIVMDEEQEDSYISENPPRYHTRDVAQYRCAQHGALLLLGSATPTIETSYYARTGRYFHASLTRRYNECMLPRVTVVDLREELRSGNEGVLSARLREELTDNLSRGEQSILFLNRRGNARMLLCGVCGAAPECPACSVPLTYHSANNRLMCHYCGFSRPAYEFCPDCGSPMHPVGAGTQKVEEELRACFPDTEILRMDADTVGATRSHEKLLKRFADENVPILIGTQMVTKGLDFENVTLVGVLAADLSLYVDNYRAPERTFNLLAQVVGRAGRGSKSGRALIQTYTPENDVIRAAAAQDYEAFYSAEIRMRKLRRYPPFADLFQLTVSGMDEGQVLRSCIMLRDAMRSACCRRSDLQALQPEVLGPASAPVLKVNNRYRYRLYIAAKNTPVIRRFISEYLLAFQRRGENRRLDIFANCNASG